MAKVVLKLPPLWETPDAKADQKRFIHPPGGQRISLAATGTKTGKTLGCSIWIIEQALKAPYQVCWWVAPYRKTAKIGFGRVTSLIPPGKADVNLTDLTVTFRHNGSRIEFRTAENPDTLFGDAVNAAVVDEGGRIREASYTAINSTMLQTRGPIRIASNTDKGRRNWLYREYLRGQSGDPEIVSWNIATPDAPMFQPGGSPGPEAIEDFKKKLSPISYQAIVLAEFPEDAATVFPGLNNVLVDHWNGELFEYNRMPHEFMFMPWPGGLFVAGLDLANRRDWTVITVVDAYSGLVVYWARFQHTSWGEQLRRVKWVQDLYGCPFLVDATPGSVGDPLLEQLQRAGVMAEGFEFKVRQKQWIVERLAIDIQEQTVAIPRGLTVLIKELEEFERDVSESGVIKYHAPDGDDNHDDAVFSLALANWSRGTLQDTSYKHQERPAIRGGIERRGFLS